MITASLVLYKSKQSEVQRVLDCVERSCIDRVYVIDNSPTDYLRQCINPEFTKAIYIFGQGNVGFGEGNNIGIKEGLKNDAKYHVVLNPDIIFEPRVIEGLLSYMEVHNEIGAIKPALTNLNGEFMASAMRLPTPFSIFARRLLPSKYSTLIVNKTELKDVDLNVTREVPNLSGSFMFLRTTVLKRVGLFDNRYFMYFEDFDLIRRIHKVSKVVYFPQETMIHAHAAEHRINKKLFMYSIRAAIKYFNKWGWIFDGDRKKWNIEVTTDKNIIVG